ncbi:hypothetical protein [Streptomyces sp. URMC 129]|uniref:hypothetical protein n=1 Tax=Streptomyces sp. URMC 129 TaxID=3423407 RepID=UPI003F1B145A
MSPLPARNRLVIRGGVAALPLLLAAALLAGCSDDSDDCDDRAAGATGATASADPEAVAPAAAPERISGGSGGRSGGSGGRSGSTSSAAGSVLAGGTSSGSYRSGGSGDDCDD